MIKILIVEDEISISHLIKLSLKRAGYACECAYDGEEAAEKLESGRYDLVLLDVMQDGWGGWAYPNFSQSEVYVLERPPKWQ